MELTRRNKIFHVREGKNAKGAFIHQHSTECKDKDEAKNYERRINVMTQAEFDAHIVARKAEKELRRMRKKDRPVETKPEAASKGPTLEQSRDKALAALKDDDPVKGEGTKATYYRVFTAEFILPLAEKGIHYASEVKKVHCIERQQDWYGKKLAWHTIRHYRRCCTRIFNLLDKLSEDGMMNPWRSVMHIPRESMPVTTEDIMNEDEPEETIPTQPISADEWAEIRAQVIPFLQTRRIDMGGVAKAPENYLALLDLYYATGLRRFDGVTFRPRRLELTDLGFRYRTRQGKTKKPVTAFIPQALAERISKLPPLTWAPGGPQAIRDKGQLPFWDGSYCNLTSYQGHQINRLLLLLGQRLKLRHPLTAHRFRTTFAVNRLNHGMTYDEVAKLMGHKDARTTRDYYSPYTLAGDKALEARQYHLAEEQGFIATAASMASTVN